MLGKARLRASFAAAALGLLAAVAPAAAAPPADPLASPMWETLAERFFAGSPVVHDARVKISAPPVLENQAQVPITVDARAVPDIDRIVVFADLNPIQHVLTYHPRRANAFLAFRMKLEQASPIRAAALTRDGVWHVGSLFLDAAGGGCTSSAMARLDDDWSASVGNAQGRLWPQADGSQRLRLRVRHPMDTGLAKDSTPAYYIEHMTIRAGGERSPTESANPLAEADLYEPVGEDPTITVELKVPPSAPAVLTEARDNNGGVYRARIPTYAGH
jgi:sulfur-oxidizing protein SoxY